MNDTGTGIRRLESVKKMCINVRYRRVIYLLAFIPGLLFGRVIRVPSDAPTIQQGVHWAADGDTVLIAPGRYVENVHILFKSITVCSEYMQTQDPEKIRSTVIDGSEPKHPDTASVIFIEGGSPVIAGLTLTGGRGSVFTDTTLNAVYREGGGIFVYNATPSILYNCLIENKATDTSNVMSAGGGGIACESANATIRNNDIRLNLGRYGAGISFSNSRGSVRNNLIVRNHGGQDFGGGGLWIYHCRDVALINNTIADNEAVFEGRLAPYGAGEGGAISFWGGNVLMLNNLVWGNLQTSLTEPFHIQDFTEINFSYNNIQDDYALDPKTHNISAAPGLIGEDYTLTSNSPCMDAGHPADLHQDPQNNELPGFAAWPSLGTVRNDIGVYGGPYRSDVFASTSVPVDDPVIAKTFYLGQNYPNPFNPVTAISYQLSRVSRVRLEVLDTTGRLIQILVNETQPVGNYHVQFEASGLASGLYFYRLISDNHPVLVRKMQLLK